MSMAGNNVNCGTSFTGRVVMIGCGSIGQSVLPLLQNHLGDVYERVTVFSSDEAGRKIAERLKVKFIHCNLTPGNFRQLLKNYVADGDLVLNLSVDVSSIALVKFCHERGALYVDTSVEPWSGVFDNPMLDLYQRTNFAIRQEVLTLQEELGPNGPTAIVDHGANPGMVSHFVKRALLELDRNIRQGTANPTNRAEWAQLACDLGVTTIQISERDTQASQRPKRQGEFVNTWSIDGYIDELMQPAEIAFGTFEKRRPHGAREHLPGSGSLYFQRPGASTFARSWTPSIGGFQGMLVPHAEVFSLADYLSIHDGTNFTYRPTMMFVYHPCDDAMLSALELEGSGWAMPQRKRRLGADIVEGMDELGVLLAGHERNAFWYGSQLNIAEARRHVPHTNATTMQVVAGVISAMMWAISNPRCGINEPESLDFNACLATATPYLGTMVGEFTDWTPLDGRGKYFPEKLDVHYPWQLRNIRSRQWYGE